MIDTLHHNTSATEFEAFLYRASDTLDYAFQPIVDIRNGRLVALEALLRGHEHLGASSPTDLLDRAFDAGLLADLDAKLRELAIMKASQLTFIGQVSLFLNLDARALPGQAANAFALPERLERFGIRRSQITFDLSRMREALCTDAPELGLRVFRANQFQLAFDDFGAGFSTLTSLCEHQPDFLKLDRYFISGVESNPQAQRVLANLVQLANGLGIRVIAEGVETEEELRNCRESGCELVQGRVVARPSVDLDELKLRYEHIEHLAKRGRRGRQSPAELTRDYIIPMQAVPIDGSLEGALELLRKASDRSFLPVVDGQNIPLGLLHETDLKNAMGNLQQRAVGDLLRSCPAIHIGASTQRLIHAFTHSKQAGGLTITDDSGYAGVLTADSLMRIIETRNLDQALNQNPLTGLPGNNSINEYLVNVLHDEVARWALVYFDLDNFKPFNDCYGFRQGDRVITLFAELLTRYVAPLGGFCGHIGGDDFFAGFEDSNASDIENRLQGLLRAFEHNVESFYDAESRQRGALCATDRQGVLIDFPLMRCSAAVVEIAAGRRSLSLDEVSHLMARVKKDAKLAKDGLAIARVKPAPPSDHTNSA